MLVCVIAYKTICIWTDDWHFQHAAVVDVQYLILLTNVVASKAVAWLAAVIQ